LGGHKESHIRRCNMTLKYYRDFCGVTAKITEHNDGTATLKVSTNKKAKKYKNVKSAQNAWYRLCNG